MAFNAETNKCASRPSAESTRAFMYAIGGALTQVVLCDHAVVYVAVQGEKLAFPTRKSLAHYELHKVEEDEDGVRALQTSDRNRYVIPCKAISKDSRNSATGSHKVYVKLTNIENAQLAAASLEHHNGIVPCVVISYDGKQVASGSIDKTVRIFNIESCNAMCAV